MGKKILALISLAMCWPIVSAEPVAVSVERLGDLRMARELRAPATVLSANRAIITSEITALIDAIAVDVGASVKKGDLLVRLDSDNAELALAQALAVLDALDAQIVHAKQRLRRAEELLEKSFVSDDELIGRQTDVAVVHANRQAQIVAIQMAELAVTRTRILAPFDATVVQRQAQVGNFAQPGTPLLTIVQSDQRELDAELDPRYAVHIPNVSNLRFVTQGRDYPVTLLRMSDVIETDTRKIRGRFSFSGEPAPIGASGDLAWTEKSGVVPVPFIVQRGTVFGVFTAKDGKANFVEIPAAQEGRPAALDLPDETLIISRGHTRVQDGDELLIGEE